MKKGIHPKWYPNCQVICSCGNSFTTAATVPKLSVQICSHCHPFFTGEEKFVDTEGRVEKFKRKREMAKKLKAKKKEKKREKKKEEAEPKTLKEMLMGE